MNAQKPGDLPFSFHLMLNFARQGSRGVHASLSFYYVSCQLQSTWFYQLVPDFSQPRTLHCKHVTFESKWLLKHEILYLLFRRCLATKPRVSGEPCASSQPSWLLAPFSWCSTGGLSGGCGAVASRALCKKQTQFCWGQPCVPFCYPFQMPWSSQKDGYCLFSLTRGSDEVGIVEYWFPEPKKGKGR